MSSSSPFGVRCCPQRPRLSAVPAQHVTHLRGRRIAVSGIVKHDRLNMHTPQRERSLQPRRPTAHNRPLALKTHMAILADSIPNKPRTRARFSNTP
jgi:hypothetical protein